MTDYSRDLAGAEHWHNAQVERPAHPDRIEWDDGPATRECPFSGEACRSDLCIPLCQHEDMPSNFRECLTCRGNGEVEFSTTPTIDPRDPRYETDCLPCGDCKGTGYIACIVPPGEYVEPWVEEGEHAAIDPPWDMRDPADDEPKRSAFQRSNNGTDDDPTWDVLRSVASGAELAARDTYGDEVVDRAVQRVLNEEGF